MYNQNEIQEICGVGYPDHDADSVVGNWISGRTVGWVWWLTKIWAEITEQGPS